MNNGVISKIYDAFKSQRKFLKIILFLCLSLLLTSCLEVKQVIKINKDGSGDARLEVAVQQEWASQIIPKLKGDMSKGWGIVEEKDKDGRHVVVFSRNFKDISELNDDEARYTFSSERKGFLKKSYTLDVKQLKSSDMPFPYEVTIKVPGSIDETSGTKTSSNEVKWNLQGLRRGTELTVKSSAFALPDFSSLKETFNRVFDSLFYKEAIVFLRDNNLWIMDSDGRNQRQLTKEGIKEFSVSRNGKIVYSREEDERKYGIYLLTIGRKIEKVISTNCILPSISPDSSKIAFSIDNKGQIIDLISREQKELSFMSFPEKLTRKIPMLEANWQWFSDDHFLWSANGKRLALRRCSGDRDKPTCLVLLYDIEKSNSAYIVEEQLLQKNPYMPNMYYIPNMYPIGFQNDKLFFANSTAIYMYESEGGKYSMVTNDAWDSEISPDSKSIAYFSSYPNLYIIDLDRGTKRQLTRFPQQRSQFYSNLEWIDDYKIICWAEIDGISMGTWIVNKDSSELKKISTNDISRGYYLSSGKKIQLQRITSVTASIAKIIILVVIALTGILLLFGMALIARKAINAVVPRVRAAPRGIFCPQCGNENSPSASFCTSCGHKLH